MRITFVFPEYVRAPVGGYKIAYEFANRLQACGHEIALVHPRSTIPKRGWRDGAEVALWGARNRLFDRPLVPWFTLNEGVRILLSPDLQAAHIPDGDVLVATSWHTAQWVAQAPASKGSKLYLIQHYETWSGDEAAVNATWKLPLHKIVISRWLWEYAQSFGEEERSTYIPYGLDFQRFHLTRPLGTRGPRVGMLYHPSRWKGSWDGIAGLELARASHPELQAVLFGTTARPKIPAWIDYVRQPAPDALLALYNSCSIFLQPSRSEGWGLPATEAMMCGCALVTTDNGGAGTYAFHGETALVAPVGDPAAMAGRINELLDDGALRRRIAEAGHAFVQQFTWSRAVDSFERVLFGLTAGHPARASVDDEPRTPDA